MSTRRSQYQIQADRFTILNALKGKGWTRPEPWMRPGDIAALVAEGRLERHVRREYDRQRGWAQNIFGGAAVCVRHRAYIRRADQ